LTEIAFTGLARKGHFERGTSSGPAAAAVKLPAAIPGHSPDTPESIIVQTTGKITNEKTLGALTLGIFHLDEVGFQDK
jgi:hypothetical protein